MRYRLSGALTLFSVIFIQNAWADTVSAAIDFNGMLVSEPCEVAIGAEGDNVVVNFGTIAERAFYPTSSNKTWLQPFHIRLKNCDLTLGTQVKVTFVGIEDSEQPGLLAASTNSGVKHLAVGIQDANGNLFAINKPSSNYALSSGSTQLDFKAYLQASPQGISAKSIGIGAFEAVATFSLDYL